MKRDVYRAMLRARQATPRRLSAAGSTDGLVLRVGPEGMPTESALEIANDVVARNLAGAWIVSPMGLKSRDFSVRRPMGTRNPDVARAFDMAYRLRRDRDVEDCEPSLVVLGEAPPEMYGPPARLSSSSSGDGEVLCCAEKKEWVVDLFHVREAWGLPLPAGGAAEGEGIVVGHPDTGYTNHPEIIQGGRLLKAKGFDFEDGNQDPLDELVGRSAGHGTGTSSVIMSAVGGDVTGVAPRAKLVPLRVTTSVVLISFGKLAESIRFAADAGHHVLSISLGGPIPSRFLKRAVQDAVDNGVIVVCAAGNVWPFVVYPAKLDEVIAVAACNCEGETWDNSASGAAVDVTAPGVSVWRADALETPFAAGPGNGTSYSTAFTAGVAALWLAYHGRDQLIARYGKSNLPAVFKELVTTSGVTRPSGWDTENFGAGILNAKKLLSASLPARAPAGGIANIRAATKPRVENQLDHVLELFPIEQQERVRDSLARMMRVDAPQLNAVMRDVGDELAYKAAMDVEFRRQLLLSRRTANSKSARASRTAQKTVAGARPHVSRKLAALMRGD